MYDPRNAVNSPSWLFRLIPMTLSFSHSIQADSPRDCVGASPGNRGLPLEYSFDFLKKCPTCLESSFITIILECYNPGFICQDLDPKDPPVGICQQIPVISLHVMLSDGKGWTPLLICNSVLAFCLLAISLLSDYPDPCLYLHLASSIQIMLPHLCSICSQSWSCPVYVSFPPFVYSVL